MTDLLAPANQGGLFLLAAITILVSVCLYLATKQR